MRNGDPCDGCEDESNEDLPREYRIHISAMASVMSQPLHIERTNCARGSSAQTRATSTAITTMRTVEIASAVANARIIHSRWTSTWSLRIATYPRIAEMNTKTP